MHVAVTGAAGMIGRKLVARLVSDGRIGDAEVGRLSLLDVAVPEAPEGWTGEADRAAGDLAEPGVAEQLVSARPEVIVHLAAVVSGEAEADFDKGYHVNLDGTRALLEAIRAHPDDGSRPRLAVCDGRILDRGGPGVIRRHHFCGPRRWSHSLQRKRG